MRLAPFLSQELTMPNADIAEALREVLSNQHNLASTLRTVLDMEHILLQTMRCTTDAIVRLQERITRLERLTGHQAPGTPQPPGERIIIDDPYGGPSNAESRARVNQWFERHAPKHRYPNFGPSSDKPWVVFGELPTGLTYGELRMARWPDGSRVMPNPNKNARFNNPDGGRYRPTSE
jgi:hypothetical protein